MMALPPSGEPAPAVPPDEPSDAATAASDPPATEHLVTTSPEPGPDAKRRHPYLRLAIRITITLAALAWTFSRLSLEDLGHAASRLTPVAATVALALTYLGLLIGAVRWRVLLGAYGAHTRPPVLRLFRLNLIGLFYNTFLPANVAGDVMRAHVTRDAFPGVTGAYVVVGVERIFGLAGLFTLGASVLALHPLRGIHDLPLIAALGLIAAVGAALAPMVGRRLAPRLPGRLRGLAASLPAIDRPVLLVPILALSVCTQAIVALIGYSLATAIAPQVTVTQALVLIPLAMIALYLPTIAGLGTREAAFVVLFGAVGVSAADATAISLAYFAAQLTVALTGGLVHLVAGDGA